MSVSPRAIRHILAGAGWAVEPPLAVVNAYLLGILAAAFAHADRGHAVGAAELPDLVVLVPAHDEEGVIAGTVAALLAQDYPAGRWEVVVVADNCSDGTADLARRAGAEVWPRDAPDARGKGHALAWALGRLHARPRPPGGVVIVDADCEASSNLLTALGRRIAAGDAAVQARYAVSNADDAPASALRFAAFSLIHDVRMAGKAHLGLSVGLTGTGMVIAWPWLERVPWAPTSITEDLEYHLELVAAGGLVTYATEAAVVSPMPTSLAGSDDQQARWEGGKAQIVRKRLPVLMRKAMSNRDPLLAHAALELVLPPQSAVLAVNAAGAAVAALSRDRPLRRLAAFNLIGQAGFVLGGLAFVRAPASAYRALVLAPALVLRKGAILRRIAGGRGPSTFVRTPR
jgi:cellulose synthase/poly-beta-1,6-N-acetylglucosamine synthase-like glycosyltransferase